MENQKSVPHIKAKIHLLFATYYFTLADFSEYPILQINQLENRN